MFSLFRPWENNCNNEKKSVMTPVNLHEVHMYLCSQRYPMYMKHKNLKSNFRRQAKSFYINNDGLLFYKKTSNVVIFDIKERQNIIKMIHEGMDESEESTGFSNHRGRDAVIKLLNKRYYWPSMTLDVKKYIKECAVCQRVNPATLNIMPELQSIPIPTKVFNHIGINLITLPEVDGYKYIAVAIDYLSKWSKACPLKDKNATTVARFIYNEIICHNSWPKIEISDQGREFCNQLCEELFKMTGTKHRVTLPYYSQGFGLVERFNRTIKNALLKIHNKENLKWPDILQGVMFAYRSVPHNSTKFSPFYVLDQRELPVDIKYFQTEEQFVSNNYKGDIDGIKFDEKLNCMVLMKDKVQNTLKNNIINAQEAQKHKCAERHPRNNTAFKIGDKVLLKSIRRDDKKGGWVLKQWVGPYIIDQIINNKSCILKNGDRILKTKQSLINIKKIYESASCDDQDIEYTNFFKRDEIRYYNPVGIRWQLEKCRILKCNLVCPLEIKNKRKLLNSPLTFKSILGDGNCLFRALSYWVTGTEDNHTILRKKVAEVVKTNSKIEKYLEGKEKRDDYLNNKRIENDGVWGTDVEVYAASILLNTSIYIYDTDRRSWNLFNKDLNLDSNLKKTEKYIYLRNFTNAHYDVVTDVAQVN